MENPMRNDSAVWCEIRCLEKGVGIEVAVHESFFESWDKFKLPEGSPEKPEWPVGSRIKGDWFVWEFKFPRDVMRKGREDAWQTRLLLQDLFDLVNLAVACECKSHARSCQLLFVEYFSVARQPKGGGFTVIVCPSLDDCISVVAKESPGRYSKEITKKMRSAGNHMAKGQRWDWGATVGLDRRIQFSGGFGTILNTSLHDLIEGVSGQRLTSDNVDGSYEQFVLLYAVAALHDLARGGGAI